MNEIEYSLKEEYKKGIKSQDIVDLMETEEIHLEPSQKTQELSILITEAWSEEVEHDRKSN